MTPSRPAQAGSLFFFFFALIFLVTKGVRARR